MTDSEISEMKTALATAMTRISSMEGELRTKPKEPAFDPQKFVQSFLLDPVGSLKRMGARPEHLDVARAALIADRLGDQAPPEMRFAAAQGPQVLAAQAMQDSIASLSRQLEDMKTAALTGGKRKSFKAITESNKTKYPNLAKALSVDEEGIMAELEKHGGSVEEFIKAQEGKWAKFGLVPAEPATTTSAETVEELDPRLKVTPAPLSGQLNTVQQPAAKTEPAPGVWNADRHAKLRDEILKKVSAPKK
jgi:hypothetical protein